MPETTGPLGGFTAVLAPAHSMPSAKTTWFMRSSLVSISSRLSWRALARGVGPGAWVALGGCAYNWLGSAILVMVRAGVLSSDEVLVRAQTSTVFARIPNAGPVLQSVVLRKYSVPPLAAL